MGYDNSETLDSRLPATGGLLGNLGPGILFAATSVGVSHLVQSTRAGASFGLGMLGIIAVALVVKYSAFRAGSAYAAATGRSLLFAYRQQGNWALYLYALVTLSTMFIALAAVTLISAGLFKVVFDTQLHATLVTTGLIAFTAVLLIRGQYRWLERVTKLLILILTAITLVTTLLALPRLNGSLSMYTLPGHWDLKTVLFATALAGWMPTALDTSVWQSLWTLEKARCGQAATAAQVRWDFNIGYLVTALLAVCFMLIGASIMHGTGTTFSATASGFAAQFIDIYAVTLGEWSRPVVGVTALAVMLSTVITVADGFPRAAAKWVMIVRPVHLPSAASAQDSDAERRWYIRLLLLQAGGALCIIYFWLSSFKFLIDLAATVSFLSAPILAVLNHRAMTSLQVPCAYRLRGASRIFSLASIGALSLFSAGYLWILLRH